MSKTESESSTRSGAKSPALPSETFCVLPWTQFYVDNIGVVLPCCLGVPSGLRSDRMSTGDSGEPLVLGAAHGVEEGWNSNFMRQIRQDMVAGRRPEFCSLCFRDEALGSKSYRQISNEEFRDSIAAITEHLDPDGVAPPAFRGIDLRLGNRCNLRCRMCYPGASKALIPEWSRLPNPDLERLARFQKLDWYARPELWDAMEKYSSRVEKLVFAGGEPLLVHQHFEFLRRLIASGQSSRIRLHYVTNGTILPQEIEEIWPQFREVHLIVSLDGYGSVNEFIRHPSDWQTIDRNLRVLDQRAEQLNLARVSFNTVVQVYNILSLSELCEYCFSFERNEPFPVLSILHQPRHFDIRILPPAMKQEATRRLRDLIQRYESKWPGRPSGRSAEELVQGIEAVITHMTESDQGHLLPVFLERNALFDQYRKQSAPAVLRELAPLFEPGQDDGATRPV